MSAPSAPITDIWPQCSNQQIKFFWRPPASNGGNPVTKYTLACSDIAYSQDLSANVGNFLVTGLTNATTYTFTITATNINGTGPAGTFASVQPGFIPFGPSEATLSTINTSTALVTWTPSTVAGEGRIRTYVIQGFPSSLAMSSFSKTKNSYQNFVTFENLSTNIYYRFLVRGVNDVGYCPPFAYTSTIGFGVGGGPAFSPSSIVSMQAWYDANDSGTITLTSSRVTTWSDKSGRGFNATGTTSTGPTYSSGNVTFGSGQTMSMSIPFTNQHTVFFVATKNTNSGSYTFYRNTGPNLSPAILTYPSGGNQVRYYNNADDAIFAATADSNFIASFTYNTSNTVVGYYNGTQAFSIPQTVTINSNGPYDRLGDGSYSGSMKEILVYSTVLASSNISSVHGYLKNKWSI